MYFIMNAGSLFDDKKATLDQINKEWSTDKHTVLVCRRERYARSGTAYSKIFVVGSGHGYEMKPTFEQYTQDTGMGYGAKGELIIDNVIEYKDGVLVNKLNDIGIDEKRNVWVMK